MFRAVTILTLVLSFSYNGFSATSGNPTLFSEPQFLESEDADIEEFPYLSSVRYQDRHRCGGVIVSSEWVLTAARCVRFLLPSALTVHAGSTDLVRGGVNHTVAAVSIHPAYNSSSQDFDVALLNLAEPFNFSSKIAPAQLISANAKINPGKIGVVSGWGYISILMGPLFSYRIRQLTIPIVDHRNCNARYANKMTERMLCVGGDSRKNVCGAAGHPLEVRCKVVGIYSWGFGCSWREPVVFTNIAAVRSWISSITGV